MRFRSILPVLFTLAMGVAAHADTYNFTLLAGAGGFSTTGTFTTVRYSDGVYRITNFMGTNTTGLFTPGSYRSNSNLFSPTAKDSALDTFGLSFVENLNGLYKVNLYGTASGYQEVLTTFVSSNSTSDPLSVSFTFAPAVAPEPSSLALLGTGALGVIGVARRRFFPAR